jgi:hypothetical protein
MTWPVLQMAGERGEMRGCRVCGLGLMNVSPPELWRYGSNGVCSILSNRVTAVPSAVSRFVVHV